MIYIDLNTSSCRGNTFFEKNNRLLQFPVIVNLFSFMKKNRMRGTFTLETIYHTNLYQDKATCHLANYDISQMCRFVE